MLTVVTDHPYQPVIEVPIYGNILDGLEIDPQNFGMRVNYFKRLASGMVKISSTGDEAFEIKNISSSFSGMKAAVIPSDECCSHLIAVVINDQEKAIIKPTTATLHIETTSEQGMIIFPVLIEVGSR